MSERQCRGRGAGGTMQRSAAIAHRRRSAGTAAQTISGADHDHAAGYSDGQQNGQGTRNTARLGSSCSATGVPRTAAIAAICATSTGSRSATIPLNLMATAIVTARISGGQKKKSDRGALMLARSCLAIAALALCCKVAAAQQPFYAGKQLTILVNYDAGGPTDLEARVLARHIGRHIAGSPRIIVQNMGGAGGIVGTKYLGEVAPRDGTMLGYFTGSSQRFVATPERFSVDFRSYEFIAVLPSGRIHFMRTDVRPGIKSAIDVVKGENIVVGGLQRDGPKDMAMRLTLDMLGARYTYVTG